MSIVFSKHDVLCPSCDHRFRSWICIRLLAKSFVCFAALCRELPIIRCQQEDQHDLISFPAKNRPGKHAP